MRWLVISVLYVTMNTCTTHAGAVDAETMETRRRGLEAFLNRIAGHPLLASTKSFHDFLTIKDDKVHAYISVCVCSLHRITCLFQFHTTYPSLLTAFSPIPRLHAGAQMVACDHGIVHTLYGYD